MNTTEFKFDELAQEIRFGNISDDDVRKIGSAMAESIEKGQSAIRIGSQIATAIKKINKKNRRKEPKPINNFYRLKKHIMSSIDGLTFWADKTMKPESEEEAECAKIILASGANMILQYARLGIDVQGVYQTFIQGRKELIR